MNFSTSLLNNVWQSLTSLKSSQWVPQRVQWHWAVQPAASPGFSLLAAPADWSHTSLQYQPTLQALGGAPLENGRRAVLCMNHTNGPALAFINAAGSHEKELFLNGKTLAQAYAWMEDQLGLEGGKLAPPIEEMPAHDVGKTAPFAFSKDEAVQTHAWFSNGHHVLNMLREQAKTWAFSVADVRCWPHHFDMATLITLNNEPNPEKAKSINAGFSPGDGNYDLPYWYVSPWPYPPQGSQLPALQGGGMWHTQGFTAAVLNMQQAVAGNTNQQATNLLAFLTSAIESCRSFLSYKNLS